MLNIFFLDRFKRILVLISHSQDFLNGVCTNIIHLHQRKLKYYTVKRQILFLSQLGVITKEQCNSLHCLSFVKGNYDQYVKTREELEENQMKRFNWEQDQIAHMKVIVPSTFCKPFNRLCFSLSSLLVIDVDI